MKANTVKKQDNSIKTLPPAPLPYSEPTLCGETVYEDENYRLTRLWKWKIESLHADKETGYLRIILDRVAYGKVPHSTFATLEGKRLSQYSFDLTHSFSEGLALVGINGKGYGFIDPEMNFIFPPQFDRAEDFKDGKAAVSDGKDKFFIDKNGNQIFSNLLQAADRYATVKGICEGTLRVSTKNFSYSEIAVTIPTDAAGIWGYINTEGEEIIKPQYIFAGDFKDGLAIVAKGEWRKLGSVYEPKNIRWGAIDTSGNTVIPFVYDGLRRFYKRSDVFAVTKNNESTVIDRNGNRLTQTSFEEIEDEIYGDLFVFVETTEEETLMGVYDLSQDKVVIPAKYTSMHLLPNGTVNAQSYDETLGRYTEKILDLKGEPLFHSEYSYIHSWKAPYETVINTEDGRTLHGLIEPDGKVIIPCIHEITYDGFDKIKDKIVFEENDLAGLKDLQGNVLIQPAYTDIPHEINGCYMVTKEIDQGLYCLGMIAPEGKEMLPVIYDAFYPHSDGKHIFLSQNGVCEAFVIERK